MISFTLSLQSYNIYLECRTVADEACIFPFKYNGQVYNGCAVIESGEFWCSTRNQADGTYESLGKCNYECLSNTG